MNEYEKYRDELFKNKNDEEALLHIGFNAEGDYHSGVLIKNEYDRLSAMKTAYVNYLLLTTVNNEALRYCVCGQFHLEEKENVN